MAASMESWRWGPWAVVPPLDHGHMLSRFKLNYGYRLSNRNFRIIRLQLASTDDLSLLPRGRRPLVSFLITQHSVVPELVWTEENGVRAVEAKVRHWHMNKFQFHSFVDSNMNLHWAPLIHRISKGQFNRHIKNNQIRIITNFNIRYGRNLNSISFNINIQTELIVDYEKQKKKMYLEKIVVPQTKMVDIRITTKFISCSSGILKFVE